MHQTYMKLGTTQPLKGTEIESNADDSCEPTRRHMNNWTSKYIIAAVLCVYILVTCHWCMVLAGKGNQQIQEKTKHHQPVSHHQKWSVITEAEGYLHDNSCLLGCAMLPSK
jgi:hypothetical protein